MQPLGAVFLKQSPTSKLFLPSLPLSCRPVYQSLARELYKTLFTNPLHYQPLCGA